MPAVQKYNLMPVSLGTIGAIGQICTIHPLFTRPLCGFFRYDAPNVLYTRSWMCSVNVDFERTRAACIQVLHCDTQRRMCPRQIELHSRARSGPHP
jgi:hypothetical protein